MTAMIAIKVGVLDDFLTDMAVDSSLQRHQACATRFAKGIVGFGYVFTAVMTKLSLGGHGLLRA
jgi:hypothetical protein